MGNVSVSVSLPRRSIAVAIDVIRIAYCGMAHCRVQIGMLAFGAEIDSRQLSLQMRHYLPFSVDQITLPRLGQAE